MHGIKKQLTVAYTPQQNRTILKIQMLKWSNVLKNFWPEAVNWSIHILNRSPTLAIQNMTPEEAWIRRRPTVDHFRIFGCIIYAHVPDQKRKNLDVCVSWC